MQKWRRPTTEEKAQGFVAMLAYWWNDSYPQSEWRWLGYTVKRMNRRVARGGELPYWITPIEPATVADGRLNDLDYWLGAKPKAA